MANDRDETISKALAALKARHPEESGVIKALEAIRSSARSLPSALKPTAQSNLPGAVASHLGPSEGVASPSQALPAVEYELEALASTLRVLDGQMENNEAPPASSKAQLKIASAPPSPTAEAELSQALGELHESIDLIVQALASDTRR